MHYILFDDAVRLQLLPFTHTRPVADIRCGIMTMRERWELLLQSATSTYTAAYLQEVFPAASGADAVWINGAVFGNPELAAAIRNLQTGQQLVQGELLIAIRSTQPGITTEHKAAATAKHDTVSFDGQLQCLRYPWDIFSLNEAAIQADFVLLTQGRTSQPLPDYVTASGAANIFLEEGAVIAPCIINATKGPVYIGKDAEIMEGCLLRGPIAMGAHSVLKMGAKVYGATTIGEGCKAGGEISNVVFFANSNKGHDGFLGNAVIGEWCNLGADTNCSNLKNNYDTVKIWDEQNGRLQSTGLQFCGLMMGDHSKCGINTMFNTGTVVGVSCNIYGGDFPEKFVPSFSWGGHEMTTYAFDKAMETAERMMTRRGRLLSAAERNMYRHLFAASAPQRPNN